MFEKPVNVMFLCIHNSARSILAEVCLNRIGKGRFKAYLAGSSLCENQQLHPLSLQVLRSAGIPTGGLHSKRWDEFGAPDAPHMDLVITVCDNAAGEVCPYWPGQPAAAHWGYADPCETEGTEEEKLTAFRHNLRALRRQVKLLVNLSPASVSRLMLQDSARNLAGSRAQRQKSARLPGSGGLRLGTVPAANPSPPQQLKNLLIRGN